MLRRGGRAHYGIRRFVGARGRLGSPIAGAKIVREIRRRELCWQRGLLQATQAVVRRGLELGAGEQLWAGYTTMMASAEIVSEGYYDGRVR
jgi:hypothetical protein